MSPLVQFFGPYGWFRTSSRCQWKGKAIVEATDIIKMCRESGWDDRRNKLCLDQTTRYFSLSWQSTCPIKPSHWYKLLPGLGRGNWQHYNPKHSSPCMSLQVIWEPGQEKTPEGGHSACLHLSQSTLSSCWARRNIVEEMSHWTRKYKNMPDPDGALLFNYFTHSQSFLVLIIGTRASSLSATTESANQNNRPESVSSWN